MEPRSRSAGKITHLKMLLFTGGIIADDTGVDPNCRHPWPSSWAPPWGACAGRRSPLDKKVRSDETLV